MNQELLSFLRRTNSLHQLARQADNPSGAVLKQFILLSCLLLISVVAKAQCVTYTENFASAITTGPTAAPNTWFVDRYAPAGFASSNDYPGGVLKQTISTADGAASRAASFQTVFFNTQGRSFTAPVSANELRVKLFIPGSWTGGNKRMAGLWGSATDAANDPSAFPIIEFANDAPGPRFRAYEPGSGAWAELGLPAGFVYNQWVTLKLQLLPTYEFKYTVITAQGNLEYTTTTSSGDLSKQLTAGILQGYNYDPTQPLDATNTGVNYDIYWDDFYASAGGGTVTNSTQGTNYCSIQAAIAAANPGDLINAGAGTYYEDVVVNKTVHLIGAGAGTTIISGPIAGGGATVSLQANNIELAGFTITREGNNVTDWNNPGLNSGGVTIQGVTLTGSVIHDNIITGNRSGIDINLSSGHTIRNNIITDNHTGIIFRNQTDNIVFIENSVTANRTAGILFLDASSGTNSPVQSALNCTFTNNSITGNWYAGVVDRQQGGSVPTPGTTNLKNFSGNWFGSSAPVITGANSAEPGYASLLPVAFGGSATAPGVAPDIAGPGSPNIDYNPLLTSGTDTNIETTSGSGTNGFQGNFGDVLVNKTSPSSTAALHIQDAVNLVATGGTVHVPVGTYDEDISISKALTLEGAAVATTIIRGTYGGSTKTIAVAAPNVTIKNFTVTRNFGADLAAWQNSLKTEGIIIENNNVLILDNLIVKDHRTGIYIHNSQDFIVKNSNITDNRTGFQIWGNLTNGKIINNKITNNFTHGIVFNFEQGPSIGDNLIIKDNFLFGNWFSQVNMQASAPGANATSTTGMDVSCNWFGPSPSYSEAVVSGAPGYTTQVPTQFSGTNTNPNPAYSLGGLNASYTKFGSFYDSDASGSAIGFTPTGACISPVHNITHPADFASIQQAINGAVANDSIVVDPGTYNENLTINKSVVLAGKGANVCGTAGRPTVETTLNAPLTGVTALISLSGAVSVTLNGFYIKGKNLGNISAADQNLTIRNSVLDLNFIPSDNNLYFNSNTLNLECNYFKAISGTNDGGSTHIFFTGAALNATKNKFTSEEARNSMNAGTTSLPTWFNLTSNANNVNIYKNDFSKIDIGILLAANAGNVKIESNEFSEAKRQNLPFGSGMGTGIAIFDNLTPANPILITKNKFKDSETGIRTSGNGTNFPASNLLTINYNSFETMIDKAISIGGTYSAATNKLNATCNYFGALTGPAIGTNNGGSGTAILDGNAKVSYKNWLIYPDTDGALGFQLPTSLLVASSGNTTVANNDYRILSNAIGCAVTGQTIELSGTFNYAGIALSEWAKGNDGISQGALSAFSTGNGDDYSILAPANTDSVTVTASALGSATIQGPSDLGSTGLESFLYFNSNTPSSSFKVWKISNLIIKDFDASIAADHHNGSVSVMESFKVMNNEIHIPVDLNKTAEADNYQNIGIHLNYGKNQEISGNKIVMNGTGVSDGTTSYSTSVALQSATSGGDAYDGLKIQNNNIHVTGTANAQAARIVGIWENSASQSASILISGNTFVNDNGGNLAENNKQLAFRVTSFSDASHNVVYEFNEISGFNRGIEWIGDPFSSYGPNPYAGLNKPVFVRNNKIDKVKFGVSVRKDPGSANGGSPAIIKNNSFTNIPTGGFAITNEGTGLTDASCNWYDATLVSTVISGGPGGVTYLPKLSNGTDDSPSTGFQLNSSNGCVLPVFNETKSLDYLTIQDAVNGADPGNIIRVSEGIYPENVTVDRPVTIYGVDSALVIVDKSNYAITAGTGFDIKAANVTLKSMKIRNFNFGVSNSIGVSNLTLESLSLIENYGAGFYSNKSIAGLIIKKSNLNNNSYKAGVVAADSPFKRGIMIQGGDADYSGIVIDQNVANSNGLVGIDLSLTLSTNGVLITNNHAKWNLDAQISAWLGSSTPASQAVEISGNTLELIGNARYGIEVKNPAGNGLAAGAGSVVVKDNPISVLSASHIGSDRDMAAIAVIRRKDGSGVINDQPQGVVLTGNTISNFQNPLAGEAYGIVVGGTGHIISGNTISNTEFPIQLQKGNENFGNNNNSSSLPAQPNNLYFDRDNSNDVCAEIGANTITGSGVPRLVTGVATSSPTLPPVRVTNTSLPAKFCTIQQGIDFTATVNGHTLQAIASTYTENVIVNKELTILGAQASQNVVPRGAAFIAGKASDAAESIVTPFASNPSGNNPGANDLFRILANNVTINGFVFDGNNTSLPASGVTLGTTELHARRAITNQNNADIAADVSGLQVKYNVIQNFAQRGISFSRTSGTSTGNNISNNLIQNIKETGTILLTNFYSDFKDNVVNVPGDAIGAHLQNFSQDGTSTWSGNTVTVGQASFGIHVNLLNAPNATLTISGNTVNAAPGVVPGATNVDDSWGINAWSVNGGSTVTMDNNIIGSAGGQFGRGINLWNLPTTNTVTINGGTVNNSAVGIALDNIDQYYAGGNTTAVNVNNTVITSQGIGIRAKTAALVTPPTEGGANTPTGSTTINLNNVEVKTSAANKGVVSEAPAASTPYFAKINFTGGSKITGGGNIPALVDGNFAQLTLANGTITSPASGSNNAVQFANMTIGNTFSNLVLAGGTSINLNANLSARAFETPTYSIVEVANAWTIPDSLSGGVRPAKINGAMRFTSGILTTGNSTMEFGPTASDIMTGAAPETATSHILGRIMMLSRPIDNLAVDMLGVKMDAQGGSGGDLDNLVIIRTTKASGSIAPAFSGDASIRTVWVITPSKAGASRGNVQFRYLNTIENVNDQDVSQIYAYRFNTTNSIWEKKSAQRSSELAGDVYTTETFGIVEFSSWTLSSIEPGPDLVALVNMPNRSFIKPGQMSRPLTARIANIGGPGTTTTGIINVFVSLGANFTLALNGATSWTLTDNGGGEYKLSNNIAIPRTFPATSSDIPLTLTAKGTVNKGTYNIILQIDDNAGGETNGDNNGTSAEVTVTTL